MQKSSYENHVLELGLAKLRAEIPGRSYNKDHTCCLSKKGSFWLCLRYEANDTQFIITTKLMLISVSHDVAC